MASNFPLSPYFREYLYDILYRMPPEDKFKLKGKYYKIGKTNFYAKRFCDTAKLDEILYVLSMLGIEWFLVLYDNGEKPEKVTNVFEKKVDGERNTELRKIIERRIHVTSVKPFIHNLATASQNIHTNIFRQHLELQKAGYHARGWTKKLGTKNVNEAFGNYEKLNYIVETILNSAVVCKIGEMSENELLLLLYLYRHQSSYVAAAQISDKFGGLLHFKKILSSRKKLILSKRIQKHSTENSYTITAFGVSEIKKVINNVLKENSF
jgi:hypothetical protein